MKFSNYFIVTIRLLLYLILRHLQHKLVLIEILLHLDLYDFV